MPFLLFGYVIFVHDIQYYQDLKNKIRYYTKVRIIRTFPSRKIKYRAIGNDQSSKSNPHFEISMCEVQNQEERLIFPEEKKKSIESFLLSNEENSD
jgi:hypothetical protein